MIQYAADDAACAVDIWLEVHDVGGVGAEAGVARAGVGAGVGAGTEGGAEAGVGVGVEQGNANEIIK